MVRYGIVSAKQFSLGLSRNSQLSSPYFLLKRFAMIRQGLIRIYNYPKFLTNKYFPEVVRRHPHVVIIAFPSCAPRGYQKVIQISHKSGMAVQPILILQVTPFANVIGTTHQLKTSHRYPFSRTNHRRLAWYPSVRWNTGPQLHQRYFLSWSHGTCVVFCRRISVE